MPNKSIVNKTIREVAGLRKHREYKGDFCSTVNVGIELEIEGGPVLSNLDRKIWDIKNDGSLRDGGIEVVNRRPVSGVLLDKALCNLESSLKDSGYSVSERCSTHIHMDCSNLTFLELRNFLSCCIVFEPVLFNTLASERVGNNFCLPTDSNTQMVSCICNLFQQCEAPSSTDEFINTALTGWPKYSAISLGRLRDLGTIEFRLFNAMTTKEQFVRVLHFLYKIREFSVNAIESPQELIDFKQVNSLRDLYRSCIGYDPETPDIDPLMEQGVQLLNDILISSEVSVIVDKQRRHYEQRMETLRTELELAQRGLSFGLSPEDVQHGDAPYGLEAMQQAMENLSDYRLGTYRLPETRANELLSRGLRSEI